jgi:hypothetical protein
MLAAEKAYIMVHGFLLKRGGGMISTPGSLYLLTPLDFGVDGVSKHVYLAVF